MGPFHHRPSEPAPQMAHVDVSITRLHTVVRMSVLLFRLLSFLTFMQYSPNSYRNLIVSLCAWSGPQHSVCRSPGSGQVQCTSWRSFAPFTSSTFTTIPGEQAGKRDRGGSAVGARHIVREHDTTQPVLNKDIKRAQGVCPWSPSQGGARGQGSSACRDTPSRGEARALHHQPVPGLTLTMPCLSCSCPTFDRWIH